MQPAPRTTPTNPLAAQLDLLHSKGYSCTIIKTSAQTICIYKQIPLNPPTSRIAHVRTQN